MDAERKAEQESIWNALKPAFERLAEAVTALYHRVGSDKQCRHLNELWHPENTGLGLGFVPPEAKEKLETLARQSGIGVFKSSGPLGKDCYFRLLYDTSVTSEKLTAFTRRIQQETEAIPAAISEKPPSPDSIFQQQVARAAGVEEAGATSKTRSTEVTLLVDGFNALTAKMPPLQILQALSDAVTLLDIPKAARQSLLVVLQKLCEEQEA